MQQHGNKYFARRTWSCCISNQMESQMQQHASTYSVSYTHPRPLGWCQRSKHFFSESSHIAYQIKGNGA